MILWSGQSIRYLCNDMWPVPAIAFSLIKQLNKLGYSLLRRIKKHICLKNSGTMWFCILWWLMITFVSWCGTATPPKYFLGHLGQIWTPICTNLNIYLGRKWIFLECQYNHLSAVILWLHIRNHYPNLNQCLPRQELNRQLVLLGFHDVNEHVQGKAHGTARLSGRWYFKLIGDAASVIYNKILDSLLSQQISICISWYYSHFVIIINFIGIRLLFIKL